MQLKQLEKIVRQVVRPAWVQESFKVVVKDDAIQVHLKRDDNAPKAGGVKNLFAQVENLTSNWPSVVGFYLQTYSGDKKTTAFLLYCRVGSGADSGTYSFKSVWITEPGYRFKNLTHYKEDLVDIEIAEQHGDLIAGTLTVSNKPQTGFKEELSTGKASARESAPIAHHLERPLFETDEVRGIETYSLSELAALESRIAFLKKKLELENDVRSFAEKISGDERILYRPLSNAFEAILELLNGENGYMFASNERECLKRLIAESGKVLFAD